ncbi:hypothetical protein CASFOL_031154 [Castilleja foliolosa]|uniref:Peptidase M48 domain-containing protein n=1 Tax=Castilleja foliolosa TaxID=1961234 RepID=A0ABD3C3Y7_9LAMI
MVLNSKHLNPPQKYQKLIKALVVTGIVKLAQFSGHMIGPILSRYHQNPQHLFSDLLMIYSVYSARLKYIPYSNKIRITFASCDKNEHSFNKLMHYHYYLMKNEKRILDPHSPEVARVMRVLTKIVQALNDGLRLRHDCRVSSANRVGCENRNEEIIVSKYGKDERRAPPEQSIEHLDGMNWEVAVVESDKFRATYHGNGKIVMHTEMLNSFDSDANLAFTLGHEVGHGVAMHMEGYSLDAVLPFAIIPWASSFWGPAIVLRLCDLVLYIGRRSIPDLDKSTSFFGVYDGHGANYAKLEGICEQYAGLVTIVEQMRMSQQGQSTPTDEHHPTRSSSTDDES